MDPAAFDRLSRALTTTPSRRSALAGLTGAVAGLISRLGPDVAAARPKICRPYGGRCFPDRGLTCCRGASCQDGRCRCPKRTRRCRGKCLPKSKCCRHADCPGTQRCAKGRCHCPAGTRRCGKRCLPKEVCCGECAVDQTCGNGRCVQQCGNGGPCRVFVTSTLYTGDLGGLLGADAKCQTRARAVGLTGTYKAWLSDSTGSPSTRFTQSTTPYQLVTGVQVAPNWAGLIDGSLDHAIDTNELGGPTQADRPTSIPLVWTKTTTEGTLWLEDSTCNDWHSGDGNFTAVGSATEADTLWTQESTGLLCSNLLPLYCFEQG